MEQLDGRVAVVTGAASGIGRALSELLLGEGMKVVMADVEASTLHAAAEALAGKGEVHPVVVDVADAGSVQALADATVDRFGAAHLVVNNAGVSGTFARTWKTTAADWKWVLDVNLGGVVNGITSFVPLLLAQDEGHIVNTASAAAFEALPGMAAYAASKHAVLAVSEALFRELHVAKANVGVSVFIPGDNISTKILESERNWPDRLGAVPDRDADPLPTMVRATFTQVFAGGADPLTTVGAVIDGVKRNDFLICDNPDLLATWAGHHSELASGKRPVWP